MSNISGCDFSARISEYIGPNMEDRTGQCEQDGEQPRAVEAPRGCYYENSRARYRLWQPAE